jgi:GH35 family endo-1,4-beta-xylanase
MGTVRSDFTRYWDQITPENEGKWPSIEGTRDQYNWGGVDRVYNYAVENNIPFKEHTIIWGSAYQGWIASLSGPEIADEIDEFMRDFCERFPETAMIDVVNEATPGHAPASYAYTAYGEDWIIRSFEVAHERCPNAILILNDYNVLRWNTDQFIEMATPVVNAGVVDAIGCQAHGLGSHYSHPVISISELRDNLDRIAALGLPIHISEYDIEQTDDQEQLAVMQEQFPVLYEHPSVLGITLWGYVVGRTWREGTGLIQDDGTPRPAMTWLMNYLER